MPDAFVYLSGQILPRAQATLDLEDRSALFADGVYEVIRAYGGKFYALDEHVARLRRSMQAIGIAPHPYIEQLPQASAELIQRNAMPEARVYWQVSRGAAPRQHQAPPGIVPTVFALSYAEKAVDFKATPRSLKAILLPDERWHRCDIKSLMLLPNVLAKTAAAQQGADEAILHRSDVITEGSATSVLIVRKGQVLTHPANELILGSITRSTLIRLAKQHHIPLAEQTFTVTDLLTADEVMICGTTTHVAAITQVQGQAIGDGKPGTLTTQLHRLLMQDIAGS